MRRRRTFGRRSWTSTRRIARSTPRTPPPRTPTPISRANARRRTNSRRPRRAPYSSSPRIFKTRASRISWTDSRRGANPSSETRRRRTGRRTSSRRSTTGSSRVPPPRTSRPARTRQRRRRWRRRRARSPAWASARTETRRTARRETLRIARRETLRIATPRTPALCLWIGFARRRPSLAAIARTRRRCTPPRSSARSWTTTPSRVAPPCLDSFARSNGPRVDSKVPNIGARASTRFARRRRDAARTPSRPSSTRRRDDARRRIPPRSACGTTSTHPRRRMATHAAKHSSRSRPRLF